MWSFTDEFEHHPVKVFVLTREVSVPHKYVADSQKSTAKRGLKGSDPNTVWTVTPSSSLEKCADHPLLPFIVKSIVEAAAR